MENIESASKINEIADLLEKHGYNFTIDETIIKLRNTPIEAPTKHESVSYISGIKLTINYSEA